MEWGCTNYFCWLQFIAFIALFIVKNILKENKLSITYIRHLQIGISKQAMKHIDAMEQLVETYFISINKNGLAMAKTARLNINCCLQKVSE